MDPKEKIQDGIDVTNRCLVGIHGDGFVILRPPSGPMTRAEALTLAAYLVVLADPGELRFHEYLRAVEDA